MRHRNGNNTLKTVFFITALLASVATVAAEHEGRRYYDEASAEQIEKGDFVLARRPDVPSPDYCLEQEAIQGYCDVAEEDVESLFYKRVPNPPRLWGW